MPAACVNSAEWQVEQSTQADLGTTMTLVWQDLTWNRTCLENGSRAWNAG